MRFVPEIAGKAVTVYSMYAEELMCSDEGIAVLTGNVETAEGGEIVIGLKHVKPRTLGNGGYRHELTGETFVPLEPGYNGYSARIVPVTYNHTFPELAETDNYLLTIRP